MPHITLPCIKVQTKCMLKILWVTNKYSLSSNSKCFTSNKTLILIFRDQIVILIKLWAKISRFHLLIRQLELMHQESSKFQILFTPIKLGNLNHRIIIMNQLLQEESSLPNLLMNSLWLRCQPRSCLINMIFTLSKVKIDKEPSLSNTIFKAVLALTQTLWANKISKRDYM